MSMLEHKYARAFRSKYDSEQAAALPPMEIKLKPGATPSRVRRRYRVTEEQGQFLKKLLAKLTDIDIIERVESEW